MRSSHRVESSKQRTKSKPVAQAKQRRKKRLDPGTDEYSRLAEIIAADEPDMDDDLNEVIEQDLDDVLECGEAVEEDQEEEEDTNDVNIAIKHLEFTPDYAQEMIDDMCEVLGPAPALDEGIPSSISAIHQRHRAPLRLDHRLTDMCSPDTASREHSSTRRMVHGNPQPHLHRVIPLHRGDIGSFSIPAEQLPLALFKYQRDQSRICPSSSAAPSHAILSYSERAGEQKLG